MTYRGHVNRYRSDAELARVLAPRCVLCGYQGPIAESVADWTVSKMRPVTDAPPALQRYIESRKRADDGPVHVCGECLILNEED